MLCESELKLRERDVALRGGELLLIDGNNTPNSQIELNIVFSYVFVFHINFYKASVILSKWHRCIMAKLTH